MTGELPLHQSDEERLGATMARDLESMTMTSAIQPSEGFADRVMLAIAAEPLPQPVRAFGIAFFGGHLRAAGSAIGDAWRVVSSGPAPLVVRAQALALVLVVLLGSLTLVGGATVGGFNLLAGPGTPPASGPPPSLLRPSPSQEPSVIQTPSQTPEQSNEPSDGPDASDTSEPQETNHETARPRTATPTETNHDGGGGGSGGGDSGAGSGDSGSGGGDHTPSPSQTEDPSSDS